MTEVLGWSLFWQIALDKASHFAKAPFAMYYCFISPRNVFLSKMKVEDLNWSTTMKEIETNSWLRDLFGKCAMWLGSFCGWNSCAYDRTSCSDRSHGFWSFSCDANGCCDSQHSCNLSCYRDNIFGSNGIGEYIYSHRAIIILNFLDSDCFLFLLSLLFSI